MSITGLVARRSEILARDVEKFAVAFWNTSLAPAGKSRASEVDLDVLRAIVNRFTGESAIDFIALCEVSDTEIQYIRKHCNLHDYVIESGVAKAGRGMFETCYIYKKASVSPVAEIKPILINKGGNNIRVAQRFDVDVGCSDEKSRFHLFLSHWPSRGRRGYNENSPNRAKLGERLSEQVANLVEQYQSKKTPGMATDDWQLLPNIILMGDYNDEPFSASLSEHLEATRDREFVGKKRMLLYNPFWRSLAATIEAPYSCGSYFYSKSDVLTRWYTFDQLIYSSQLVHGPTWRMREESNQVFAEPELLKLITNDEWLFDHLPVVGRMEKVG